MKKYRCTVCDYVYDPEKGDPENNIKPGTAWSDVPDDWECPECNVGKDNFEEIKKYDGITNPYARERGLPIYLCINPSDDFLKLYRSRLAEEFARFRQ